MNTTAICAKSEVKSERLPVWQKLTTALNWLSPIADLAVRLWVANVFFKSGLVKIQSWESTVALFTYEYSVPYLSPELAAYLGVLTELFFPVLLAVGLAGRLSAGVLFVFNIMAVISYPALNVPGLEQHQVWGLLLLVSFLHGPGKLSLTIGSASGFSGPRADLTEG
ncbi:MAG: DoxX family protein [Gammaproteobacteria bacterium]